MSVLLHHWPVTLVCTNCNTVFCILYFSSYCKWLWKVLSVLGICWSFLKYRHLATYAIVDWGFCEKLKDIEVITFEKHTKVYLVAVKLKWSKGSRRILLGYNMCRDSQAAANRFLAFSSWDLSRLPCINIHSWPYIYVPYFLAH